MDSAAFNPDELGEEWKDYDFEKIPSNLLSTRKRSYLVHSEGEVDVFDHVDGKTVGLYFSAGPCQYFTLKLADVYNELSANGGFEVVYVSSDDDQQLFEKEFADMPWLAVPYDDSETRDMLTNSFKVPGFPHLVFLDEFGKVLSDEGVEIIESYGVKGYPFTLRRLEELKEQEEAAAKSNQSSKSIFVSDPREFLHSADGKEGYPYSPKRVMEPRKQSLQSILVSSARNFLIGNRGIKVRSIYLCGVLYTDYISYLLKVADVICRP